ncbi:MAG: insulinase family protein [Candidatus Dojkabacteria bacterium]|nr:MAG: insulinase family protein [Candidatus Dojkabacteria bacterium]
MNIKISSSTVTYEKISPSVHFLYVPHKKGRYKTKLEAFFTRGGSFFESRKAQGISHFMEHCIVTTFDNWTPDALNKYLSTKGISRNAGTGLAHLSTEVSGHHSDEKEMFDIFKKITFDPNISEQTLESERKIILAEMAQKFGHPQYQLAKYIDEHMYTTGSPNAYETLGTEEHVKQISLANINERYSSMIHDSHCILLGTGLSSALVEEVKQFLSEKKSLFNPDHQMHERTISQFKEFQYLPIVHKYARDTARIIVMIPCEVEYENQGQRHLLNRLLIRGMYGYLYNTLREKLKMIYHLQSSFVIRMNYLEIEMIANIEHVEEIINVVRGMFDPKIIKQTKKDFQMIKKSFLKVEQIQNEDAYYSEIGFIFNNLGAYNKPYTLKDYMELIKKTSFDDVLEVHTKIKNNLEKMRVVIISNNAEIENLKLF